MRAADDYLPTVAARLAELPARAPAFDLCLYNAGMDPHEGCPIGGLPGITTEILAGRERLVFAWCRRQRLPVAFVLAGGYTGPALDERGLVALHSLTLAAAAGGDRAGGDADDGRLPALAGAAVAGAGAAGERRLRGPW